MSDLLNSILEILKSVWELFRVLGPGQSMLCILGAALGIYFGVLAYRACSFNPKYYSDEYVKSHMHVFHDWFVSHPEDKSRYV